MTKTRVSQRLWTSRWSGWALILIFSLIPVIRLISNGNIGGQGFELGSWYNTFASLGRIAGLIGFVLYAINLVLSLRKKWLENLFNGLNRVYVAHHITGGIALILLLFHPVFLALRYIEIGTWETLRSAAEFLIPRGLDTSSDYIFKQSLAIDSAMLAFTGLVVLLAITFFIKLPYQLWLLTHKFLGPAFFFAVLHVFLIDSTVARDGFLKTYMLGWGVIGLTAYSYRTLLGRIFIRRYQFEVTKVGQLAKDVTAVQMKPLNRAISLKAGQFVFVRFLGAKKSGVSAESHPFSVAGMFPDGVLQICAKASGDFTKTLKKLKIGVKAEIEGAFGRFDYTAFPNHPQVWVAGGIGITPFLNMASRLDKNSPSVHLFYSVKEKSELLRPDMLASVIPKRAANFSYTPYVTGQTKALLDADYLEKKAGNLRDKHIFLCGPPTMMRSLRRQFKNKGIKPGRIHSEEFSIS